MAPDNYIEHIEAQYVALFREKPSLNGCKSPLEQDGHRELDVTPLLDDDGISKYHSIIGALQWAISLGRFDLGVSVMTMSLFSAAP